jgi:hypothetical protein
VRNIVQVGFYGQRHYTCMHVTSSSHALLFLMLDVIGVVTTVSDAMPLQTRSHQSETFKRIVTIRDERLVTRDWSYEFA